MLAAGGSPGQSDRTMEKSSDEGGRGAKEPDSVT